MSTAPAVHLDWQESPTESGVWSANGYRIITPAMKGESNFRLYHRGRWMATTENGQIARACALAHAQAAAKRAAMN